MNMSVAAGNEGARAYNLRSQRVAGVHFSVPRRGTERKHCVRGVVQSAMANKQDSHSGWEWDIGQDAACTRESDAAANYVERACERAYACATVR